MNNPTTQSIMTIAAAVLVVCCAAGGAWYWSSQVTTMTQRLRAQESGAVSDADYHAKIQALREEARATGVARATLKTRVITTERTPAFLSLLEQSGTSAVPVVVNAVNLDSEGENLHVAVSYRGSFTEVLTVTDTLAHLPIAVTIDFLDIKTRAQGGWEVQARLTALVHNEQQDL